MTKPIMTLLILLLTFNGRVFSQDNSQALATADTNNFSVNKDDGWLLYNSYLNKYQIDSVDFEIIIQHDNNIDLMSEQFIGKIKSDSLKPLTRKELLFDILGNIYMVQIYPDGKCFLRFVSGIFPSSDHIVLGIIVHYRI